jgi:hypothetical protein
MTKRIFYVVLPLLIGVIIGFYLRDSISQVKPNKLSNAALKQAQHDNVAILQQSVHAQRSPQGTMDISVADIQTTLERLKNISDLNKRASMRNALLRRWAELDGRGALDYVLSLEEGEIKVQAMAAVAGVLAHSDPQLLAEKALTMPSNRSSRELIQNLANSWAQTDAAAALKWAEQLPEGLGKRDALAIVRFQLAKQDPEETSAEIRQLPAGDARNSLISNLAAQWGSTNPQSAIDWANTLPENEKKLAMSNLVGAWAQNDPLAAGTYVAQMPSGEAQSQATMSVVSSWATKNPDQTAAWVLQFPEGELRQQGIREVVSIWTLNDSKSVQNWAEGLPEGPTRDLALKSYVDSIGYWSPDKAAVVAELIDDSQKRDQSMETATRLWGEIDPKAARNWVARLNVSDEFRARLQSLLSTN